MNVVWSLGQVTVSDVWKAFLADRKISRGSVQTMMIRLEEKGWLSHREVGQAFLYQAVYPQEATQQRLALELADGVFGGSTEGLIWSLLQNRGVSKAEAERLHDIIDAAERKRKKRTRKP
jgi:predicted transcriptional regulator